MQESRLKECVREFFEVYLNRIEESDSGKPFNPISISCCRAMMLEPLNKLLDEMCTLSGAKQKETTQ
jgi:3'-phosphoadenosine 5'-phosphosulfate sulfotransferase (PAPS reductase)/FAD synthetase